MGVHTMTSSSSRSYVLLASRSRDDNKVNNYRWQSDDINSSNNNKNNRITKRSYGDRSSHGQIKTFTADGSSVIYDLDTLIPPMNRSSIASFMQKTSKYKHRFYGEDLMKIVQKLTDLPDSMSMIQLSQLVNSLRIYDDKDKAVAHLIKVITKKVRNSEVILGSLAVGNMLYGLKGMKSDSLEVLYLLTELTKLVKTCTEPLNAQDVSMMLYGLQGMSIDCPDVIGLLRELPQLVMTCKEQLKAREVGMMLYGLQGVLS